MSSDKFEQLPDYMIDRSTLQVNKFHSLYSLSYRAFPVEVFPASFYVTNSVACESLPVIFDVETEVIENSI